TFFWSWPPRIIFRAAVWKILRASFLRSGSSRTNTLLLSCLVIRGASTQGSGFTGSHCFPRQTSWRLKAIGLTEIIGVWPAGERCAMVGLIWGRVIRRLAPELLRV